MTLAWTEIAERLITATLLTGLVGLDRERRESSAGLRTHALVGMSACLLMIASTFGFADILGTANVVLDPSRIAAQVVTGIGFLGAGTIIAHGSLVRGLTTAASVWSVAAIGLAVGGGMYWAALVATGLALILLIALRPLERRLDSRWRSPAIRVLYDPQATSLEGVLASLRSTNLHVKQLSVTRQVGGTSHQVEIMLDEHGDIAIHAALQALTRAVGVQRAESQ
jgi:putative Mg2+ transporter-C (MgtC) family protein